MLKNLVLLGGVVGGLGGFLYEIARKSPPKICGSIWPPITSPTIQLKDGRHLAYQEYGVPKDVAKHKIVFIHGIHSCRLHVDSLSPNMLQREGIYLVLFDRPGNGESDPHPNQTLKSMAFDIQELADQLGLGEKFYIIGHSMGGQVAWACLNYIPHRLAGAALLAPIVNYWWPGFPPNMSQRVYKQQLIADQWALGVAHYMPWLSYFWNTQMLFPRLSEYESIDRDLNIAFGTPEFDPMDLKNPFPKGEGSVHLWQGDTTDRLVPVSLQRYIAKKLPWIQYHELPDTGHHFIDVDDMTDKIIQQLISA